MKIYISLPITGHELHRVKNHAETIKQLISSGGHEVITPFDVCPEEDRPYSYYMGRDIEALLDCDAIFMAQGWEASRGCTLEHRAASLYGKHIFTSVIIRDSKTILI